MKPWANLAILLWRLVVGKTVLGLLAACSMSTRTGAQEQYTRFELGGQFSTIRETDTNLQGKTFVGFGGRVDWNLNRRLAFETQVDFFPQEARPLFQVQGGRTLQAVFGLRAKVIQTRNFSVFGLVRPVGGCLGGARLVGGVSAYRGRGGYSRAGQGRGGGGDLVLHFGFLGVGGGAA